MFRAKELRFPLMPRNGKTYAVSEECHLQMTLLTQLGDIFSQYQCTPLIVVVTTLILDAVMSLMDRIIVGLFGQLCCFIGHQQNSQPFCELYILSILVAIILSLL